MNYSIKNGYELLELIDKLESVISKQNKIIKNLTHENLELANFIEATGIEETSN